MQIRWSQSSMRSSPGQMVTRFSSDTATRKDCQILFFAENKRNHQYVICPEQECECLVYHANQNRSMIEVLGLAQDPLWEPRVKASIHGNPSPAPRLRRMRGHGKAKTVKNGPPKVRPSEVKVFLPIQQIDRILKNRDCNGQTLVKPTSSSPSCIQARSPILRVQ